MKQPKHREIEEWAQGHTAPKQSSLAWSLGSDSLGPAWDMALPLGRAWHPHTHSLSPNSSQNCTLFIFCSCVPLCLRSATLCLPKPHRLKAVLSSWPHRRSPLPVHTLGHTVYTKHLATYVLFHLELYYMLTCMVLCLGQTLGLQHSDDLLEGTNQVTSEIPHSAWPCASWSRCPVPPCLK